jgi:capsular polysaccharide export protein
MSNLDLLIRARALEGDAWIIYKPHPDVEAGHRKGYIPTRDVLRYANEIALDAPILPLIAAVDALHVITSLAGFEALLRGKSVTAHGTPFYAGWGLTNDLAPVPSRRTRGRSLDELVAATLLLYPRYVDPVTRLPCSAELVVQRIARGQASVQSPLITLRTWQGRMNRAWQYLAGGRR